MVWEGADPASAATWAQEARGASTAEFDPQAALLRLKPLSTLGSAILKVVFAYPPVRT